MDEEEIWRNVPGYAGLYRISSQDQIFNLTTQVMLTANVSGRGKGGKGRKLVALRRDGTEQVYRVDRLVLETFVGPAPGSGSRPKHLDGDVGNCRLDNLQWASVYTAPRDRQRRDRGTSRAAQDRARVAELRETMRSAGLDAWSAALAASQPEVPDVQEDKTAARKRSDGTGSVYYDKSKKRWFAQVSLGFDATGKRRVRRVRAVTQEEAEARLADLRAELDGEGGLGRSEGSQIGSLPGSLTFWDPGRKAAHSGHTQPHRLRHPERHTACGQGVCWPLAAPRRKQHNPSHMIPVTFGIGPVQIERASQIARVRPSHPRGPCRGRKARHHCENQNCVLII